MNSPLHNFSPFENSNSINVRGDRNVVQSSKYNVNIGKEQDIHVGDRIYQGENAEVIAEVIKRVIDQKLAESPLNRREDRLRNRLLVDVNSRVKRDLNNFLFNKKPINMLKEKEPELVNPSNSPYATF